MTRTLIKTICTEVERTVLTSSWFSSLSVLQFQQFKSFPAVLAVCIRLTSEKARRPLNYTASLQGQKEKKAKRNYLEKISKNVN